MGAAPRPRVQKVLKGRFLGLTGPMGRRVLKFDGAFGPEGCGIALTGDEYKVSVTDLLSVPYGMISILVISRCAAPPLSGCAGLSPIRGTE